MSSMEKKWPWGTLQQLPLEGLQEYGARLFPVVCGGRISECLTLNRKRFSPYENGQAVEQIVQL